VNAFTTSELNVQYRRNTALIDCNLAVPEGRISAVVGTNGAGKTTLLNCLAGIVQPSSGWATVLNELPVGSREARECVAFVAQDSPLYKNLTVSSMVSLTENLNDDFDRQLANRRLVELGLSGDRKIHGLSFGQQAQISLTLALARHPALLILDEPLARLDPIARRDFMRLVMSASVSDGVSVLFASHVIAELEPVADYLILLRDGQVLAAEGVEGFLTRHCVLTGPASDTQSLKRCGTVLELQRSGRQARALVRDDTRVFERPIGWECEEAYLEELLLVYLGRSAEFDLPIVGGASNIVNFPTCMH
jgi:ABC-2 type transport system ATP-binding protein